MSEDERILTPPQEKALEAILEGCTYTEAASVAEVRRETVSQWVNHDARFRDVLADQRKDRLRAIRVKSEAIARECMGILLAIARNEGAEPKDRVSASKALLDRLGVIEDDGSNVQRVIVELAPEVPGQADPQPNPPGPEPLQSPGSG